MKAEFARLILAVLLSCLAILPARAADKAGDFTHYVLALSWNATWCTAQGDARDAKQCHPRHDYGFTLHGLWPQAETGWPAYCQTSKRDPSRTLSATMADIMGSAGLAWHQWKKHGRCSALPAVDYFALSREAYSKVQRPEVLRRISKPLKVKPEVVEAAFLKANPWLAPDQISVTCRDGFLHEVRICLTKSLAPRACTAKVERGCRAQSITVLPMR